MEADWELELGSDAPIIDAHWSGFIDLRNSPNRIADLQEIQVLPALADILVRLNAPTSPVWTAKCDVWQVVEPIDPYELDAAPETATHALACYIDLLPRSDQQWPIPPCIAAACKAACERLRTVPLGCCRVDLVARQASIAPGIDDLGITAYITACGPEDAAARHRLAAAATAFADTLLPAASPAPTASPLQ